MKHRIQNFKALSITPQRKDALTIAEAAYDSIDTTAAIHAKISCEGNLLMVEGRTYDLTWYKRIRVIGFGKVSCAAALALESFLRTHIKEGIVIDVRPGTCDVIQVEQGSHPKPSADNFSISKRIVEMATESNEQDLVIVIVSGGGSSLLCWPLEECTLSARLYEELLKTGATIQEMNTVRKHISDVKGGGLAKMLYPATVVGLIFCDIPGDHFEEVASGPTYFDSSTAHDATAVLEKYQLTNIEVHETPKEQYFFERVQNVRVVSNTTALDAMEKTASQMGYSVIRAGSDLFDTPPQLIDKLFEHLAPHTAVIAAGEPSLTVTHKGGKGGRCQYVALQSLTRVQEEDTFLAFASDGIDNTEAAGAIADKAIRDRVPGLGLSIEDRLADYDTYSFFEKTDGLIMTGVTEANVSDLFILIRS